MKTLSIKRCRKSNFLPRVCFLLLVSLLPIELDSQNYRTVNAYLEDFGKNEMFIKKALMDYTITIVESQLDSRSKVTAERIVEKINIINNILRKTDNGFNGNTSLRDNFIKMNERTVESLNNGSLVLTDYEKYSDLSLTQLVAFLNKKETEMMGYYQELKNYELERKQFGRSFNLRLKKKTGKDILEYNAFQNMMCYKLNVINEKFSKAITDMDYKSFEDCLKTIELMHEQTLVKTTQLKNYFKDNSLNEASIVYADYIYNEVVQISALFEDYSKSYEIIQIMKKPTATETNEVIAEYNRAITDYNAKKNKFYKEFGKMSETKKTMFNNWLLINAAFLKNNCEFENLHEKYVIND